MPLVRRISADFSLINSILRTVIRGHVTPAAEAGYCTDERCGGIDHKRQVVHTAKHAVAQSVIANLRPVAILL